MERFMVNCAANPFRTERIHPSLCFCQWILDWQENEGRRMVLIRVQSGHG